MTASEVTKSAGELLEEFPLEAHGIDFDTSSNSSFSRQLPGLQLGIDSTSLGEFKTCPRKYFYSIICGYQPRQQSVHLTFGLLLHSGVETYHRARSEGNSHEDALDWTLDNGLKATWVRELNRPWSADHPQKNRLSLTRALVWYLDQYKDDALKVVHSADGKPLVELTFKFDSGYRAKATGEAFTLCGHLDRIVETSQNRFVADVKTTTHQLAPRYFEQFDPDNQFSLYSLAGKVAFEQDVKGVIVDALQIGTGFIRMHRHLISRDSAKLDEWLADLEVWLSAMEQSAVSRKWPMNDKACGLYGGCPFREVCASSPTSRRQILDSQFKRRTWDPLITRGDI